MSSRVGFVVGRRVGGTGTVWLLRAVRPPIRGPWLLRAIISRG
ncbi:MAG TPA: hypothetical protein VNZ57_01600 [Longimicrobiales bacterium]|nr:hypothetical protein [Longimicrobiales bacterium]